MKETGLPVVLRLAGRSVILLGEGDAAEAKRRLIQRAGGVAVGESAAAALAIVALEDDAEAEAAIARLKARGVLVNAVDRLAFCDFTLPAIVDRDPLLLAIATGGASAGLAAALRQRLEALVPESLGQLARGLFSSRATMRARWPDGAERRRALAAALAEGGPLDPLAEHREDAVARWLAAPEQGAGGFFRMTLASSDPDELTLRQARQLSAADVIYHRHDVPPAILSRARADAARMACDAAPAEVAEGLVLDIGMAR